MVVTAVYSLTFLIGTFLLPDFDKPKGREELPKPQDGAES